MQGKNLAGRTAVVTGARRGIGRAIALRLGAAGARLALVDHESAEEAAAEARQAGADAQAYRCDVRDAAAVERLAGEVGTRFPSVNIVVNAAGIPMRRRISEISLEEWQQTIDVNLTGPFLVARAFLPRMRGQGYGRIVNMTSVMAHIATGDRPAYCAAKAGLLSLTRSLACEWAGDRISVNAIAPGVFPSDLNSEIVLDTPRGHEILTRTPMGRFGKPDELVPAAILLAGDGASFLTGQCIAVDGGYLASGVNS